MDCYRERIAEISKLLEEKTLGEIEDESKTGKFNYVGVGFGYNQKDNKPATREEAFKSIQTPEFDELVEMAKAL